MDRYAPSRNGDTERVLVCAFGRDAEKVRSLAARLGMTCETCADLDQLAGEIRAGAGAAVIAQETFQRWSAKPLEDAIAEQPDWSDFPIVFVATRGGPALCRPHIIKVTATLGNVVCLERPVRIATFTTTLQSALRARRRQYQVRRSQQLTHEALERLELALDAAELGMWESDLDTREIKPSRRLLAMIGLDAMRERADWLARVHPDDRACVEAAAVQAAKDLRVHESEFRVVRPDGEVRWALSRMAVVTDPAGRPIRTVGFAQDITARKEAEQALRRSESLYRGIARGIPDAAVWVVDAEMRYILVEGMLVERIGLDRERLEGRTVSESLDDRARELAERHFQKALAGEPSSCEADYGGRMLWAHFAPLRDDRGHIFAAMALTIDVTERRRVEAQLRQTQKLESIGVLAGGIAHDFNNLLTTILGNASLIQPDAPPEISDRVQSIVEAAEKAAALTRQLLAYAGKGRFTIADVDILSVINSSMGLLRVSVPTNVEFVLDIPPDVPAVKGDPSQIQQVVMNLVINAAEAIGPMRRGRVSLRAGVADVDSATPVASAFVMPRGKYVFLEVSDTGAGMDEETLSRIFDPFFTTKFTGRGLGLAAVEGILRSHGGGITVRSSPGQGSTFTVYLPPAVALPAAPELKAGPRPTTVLVVDDEPDVRDFIRSALGRLGYNTLLAANGREALDILAATGAVDLVILDIVMPVLGGGETLMEIRKRRPGMPVLITSGYNREEADRLGALPPDVAFIQKPYTAAKLTEAVQDVLNEREQDGEAA